ncbi:molybdopterin molybdotransferase MoeA [Nocardioides panacisoli]|uniref:molybdopterin molybdotransferase MoeA n=1 Tax=Nocardioides panacisoli TaxID=627624 RepID=UPI001C63656D|nr:gephyrin-like molybdotransferase Glp [Nocardioides panacisoli]QYJ02819.1 molybdopterin molybdotransferase MoeA [Nocardioides panacisoli]
MADSVAAHRARVLGALGPVPTVAVPLAAAAGCVTAADAVAALAVPRFDNAAMDGYAVRARDVAGPATLPVAGVVAAGAAWEGPLPEGAAVRIMTGAPVPADADAVVPFEWTDRGADRVRIDRAVAADQHVRRAGEDVTAGAVAVPAGTLLRPAHLGLLAATGCREVVVRRRPRVAVLATGAELGGASPQAILSSSASADDRIACDDDLPPGHLPDSNSVTIAAAVRAAGGEATVWGPAPDETDAFLALLARAAADADLVLTTGGISAGDHDVVKAALADHADTWFGSVAVKPGRPQGAGVLHVDGRDVPLVCLPGTPVAAYTSFRLFVEPALAALRGTATPREMRTLAAPATTSPERTVVLPARLAPDGRVRLLPGHAGHSQQLLADADVLLVLPPGPSLVAGETVEVLPL